MSDGVLGRVGVGKGVLEGGLRERGWVGGCVRRVC